MKLLEDLHVDIYCTIIRILVYLVKMKWRRPFGNWTKLDYSSTSVFTNQIHNHISVKYFNRGIFEYLFSYLIIYKRIQNIIHTKVSKISKKVGECSSRGIPFYRGIPSQHVNNIFRHWEFPNLFWNSSLFR